MNEAHITRDSSIQVGGSHICSNCSEPTNIQVWTPEGWEWLCSECYAEMVPAAEREDDEPRDYTPYEETQSYREAMIDAGRGHLLR